MIRSEGDRLRAALVCPPGPAYAGVRDLAGQNIAEVPDGDLAQRQHGRLAYLLSDQRIQVVPLTEPPEFPNATFTRDPALVTPEGYVQLRMGLPARGPEPAWIAAKLDRLEMPRLGAIEPPGSVEGGDVVLDGSLAFAGLSSRTNREGLDQLAALLRPLGYELRVAAVPGTHLHLGSVMSIVAPGRAVAVSGIFDRDFLAGLDVIDIPPTGGEASGANVLCLGPDRVVANEGDGPLAIELLERRGVRVDRLDLSEFRKGNGGPTCLVLPLERG